MNNSFTTNSKNSESQVQNPFVQQQNANLDEQVKEAKQMIEMRKSMAITIKKGEVKKPGPLVKFFNNSIGAALGVGFALVTSVVLLNEATGLVRIGGKTPLTVIRRLISKDKP